MGVLSESQHDAIWQHDRWGTHPHGNLGQILNCCGKRLAFVYTGAMLSIGFRQRSARGVVMRPMRLVLAAAALLALSEPLWAFQESGASQPEAEAPAEAPKNLPAPSKSLNLKMPEMSIGQGTGTEVKIPGFGTVGVLPKLDFGLELLYGATDARGPRPDDKSEPSDVQIRGTIKHRF